MTATRRTNLEGACVCVCVLVGGGGGGGGHWGGGHLFFLKTFSSFLNFPRK